MEQDPTNPYLSSPIEISDNEDINYQINTTSTNLMQIEENATQEMRTNNPVNKTTSNIPKQLTDKVYTKKNIPQNNNGYSASDNYLSQENQNYLNSWQNQMNTQFQKEHLMETLRKEIIKNEEQRNYIEILKETIESNLFKTGFGYLIQSTKEFKNSDKDTIVNFFIDFSKIKNENEGKQKEIVQLKNYISDRKEEIATLRKQNEDLLNENNWLKVNKNNENARTLSLTEEKLSNEKALQNWNISLTALRNQARNYQEQIADQNNINMKQNHEIISNQNQIELMRTEISKYKIMEEDYLVLKEKNKGEWNRIISLQQSLNEKNEEISTQNREIERASRSCTELIRDRETWWSNLEEWKTKYNSLVKDYNCTQKVNEHLIKTEKELDGSYEQINHLRNWTDKLKQTNDNNNELLNDYRNKIDSLETDNNSKSRTWINLEKQWTETEAQCNRVMNENKNWINFIDNLKHENNEITRAYEELKLNFERNEHIIQRYQEQENAEKNDLANYKNEILDLKHENIDLKQKFEALEQNHEIEKGTNKHLNEKVMSWENLLNKVTKEKDKDNDEKFQMLQGYSRWNTKWSTSLNWINTIPETANNWSPKFSESILSSLKPPQHNPSECQQSSIDNYIENSAKEILQLNSLINELKYNLKNTSMKLFDTEQELQACKEQIKSLSFGNKGLKAEQTRIDNEYNMLLNDNKNKSNALVKVKSEWARYQKELEDKHKWIANINYDLSWVKDENLKWMHACSYLESICKRTTQVYQSQNLYRLIHQVTDTTLSFDEKEKINDQLMFELKKGEDYLKMVKDNSWEMNLLNKRLSKHWEDSQLQGWNSTMLSSYSMK